MLHALLRVLQRLAPLPAKPQLIFVLLVRENVQFYSHSTVNFKSKSRCLSEVVVYNYAYCLITKLAVRVESKGSQPVFKSSERCVFIYGTFAIKPFIPQTHFQRNPVSFLNLVRNGT